MSTVVGEIHGTTIDSAWGRTWHQVKASIWRSLLAGAILLSEMSFLDHLEELRRRIIKCAIAVGIGLMVCLSYSAEIIRFLGRPAEIAGIEIVAIEATEIFSVYFKVAAAGGICLASPVLLWQLWRFIEPALYRHEKRYAVPFLLSTIACFVVGAAFGLVVAAPWFLTMESAWGKAVHIKITMSALSYFGLLTATVVAMGAVFEMPPIVVILSRIGIVDARFLVRHLKHAILIFAVVASAATPTGDLPPTIAFMSVMLAIYVVCIVLAWLFGKPRKVEA